LCRSSHGSEQLHLKRPTARFKPFGLHQNAEIFSDGIGQYEPSRILARGDQIDPFLETSDPDFLNRPEESMSRDSNTKEEFREPIEEERLGPLPFSRPLEIGEVDVRGQVLFPRI